MQLSLDDVIVAPATAFGVGLRSIVRLSGDEALMIARRVFEPTDPSAWPPQHSRMLPGHLALESPWERWSCLAAVWPDRRSFTCQPCVELHTPASPWAVERLITRLIEAGARPARPGEFTLRAYLGGRLDLTQAEAILGVIDANDETSLREGLTQLAGGLSQRLKPLRARLLDLLADLEAGLDFVDEDIEFVTPEVLRAGLYAGLEEIKRLLETLDDRGDLAEPPSVVLVGSPNAGKSRLFNRMTQADRAIVATVAGTTRDPLVAEVPHRPTKWRLVDTAGLDPARLLQASSGQATQGPVETDAKLDSDVQIDIAAQQLALERIARADVCLLCVPADATTAVDFAGLMELIDNPGRAAPPVIKVRTMADRIVNRSFSPDEILTSSQSGEGISSLVEQVEQVLGKHRRHSGVVASTGIRSRGALLGCREHLEGAIRALDRGAGEEWIAAELRQGLNELGTVTGEIHTEDLLERIFARFCIGK